MLTDQTLECVDCKGAFLFSIGEQQFFLEKKLTNLPKRCHNCRLTAKMRRNGTSSTEVYKVNCAECSAPALVPFKPAGNRPLYCQSCLVETRNRTQSDAIAV